MNGVEQNANAGCLCHGLLALQATLLRGLCFHFCSLSFTALILGVYRTTRSLDF